MKRIALWVCGSILGLILSFAVLQTLASERVEVVELFTVDEDGAEVVTRLWIVDHEGRPFLRVAASGSGWYARLQAQPDIHVRRDDQVLAYRAVPDQAKSEIVNRLMRDKYTWGDAFFATVFGSREGSIPIELRRIPEGT